MNSSIQRRHCSFRNPGTKVTITMPLLARTRGEHVVGHVARTVAHRPGTEWEKNAGAVEVSSAACIVVGATWDRSTMTPSRLHSRTTS